MKTLSFTLAAVVCALMVNAQDAVPRKVADCLDAGGRWVWTEETAVRAVRAKIADMRTCGYHFAADALGHFLANSTQNIDLSRYAGEIYNNSEWRDSFLASVQKRLSAKDPQGTGKKVQIGDIAHKASFGANLQTGVLSRMFAAQFGHRFYPNDSMGLFYALYGSHYSYIGTASWSKRRETTPTGEETRTRIELDLQVVSWDMLLYDGGFPRTMFPSYSAAQYLQKEKGYKKPFVYLKWREKGTWEVTDRNARPPRGGAH